MWKSRNWRKSNFIEVQETVHKVWIVVKCLREALFFLSLDYTGKGLSSSSESEEEESRAYNEAV